MYICTSVYIYIGKFVCMHLTMSSPSLPSLTLSRPRVFFLSLSLCLSIPRKHCIGAIVSHRHWPRRVWRGPFPRHYFRAQAAEWTHSKSPSHFKGYLVFSTFRWHVTGFFDFVLIFKIFGGVSACREKTHSKSPSDFKGYLVLSTFGWHVTGFSDFVLNTQNIWRGIWLQKTLFRGQGPPSTRGRVSAIKFLLSQCLDFFTENWMDGMPQGLCEFLFNTQKKEYDSTTYRHALREYEVNMNMIVPDIGMHCVTWLRWEG